MRDELVPDADAQLRWIEQIEAQGIRRPAYPADRFAERFCAGELRRAGLRVRLEPVQHAYWEPRLATAEVFGAGGGVAERLECFALPFCEPTGTEPVELELIAFDPAAPERVRGAASLYDVVPVRVPPAALADAGVHLHPGDGGLRAEERCYDPGGSLEGALQVLPLGREVLQVMEPSLAAGAAAFVGVLRDYPGGGCEYYVPYDAIERPIPGVWLRGADGARLRERLAREPLRVRLRVEAERGRATSHNVVGELDGADDELVVIGSHHDGPWTSAVEDGSGIALVLAQARYWSQLPREERPHGLRFLLNAAHMAGGAGVHAFLDAHAAELDRIVLELHLEHAAREFAEGEGGALRATGLPEPRWFFTSRIDALERGVLQALRTEGLERSLILRPDAFAPFPTTDGGPFHTRGVPLVNFLAAPFYLFDVADRMDKVDRDSLVPLTRAAIRIVESTRGISARAMRAAVRP